MQGALRLLLLFMLSVAATGKGDSQGGSRTPILRYIKNTWHSLTRTHADFAAAAVDPKFHPLANGRWPVWIAENEDESRIETELRSALKADFAKIELCRLPHDFNQIRDHGLLYLPRPYVVPGGRFNEMYGWDSYFIEVGLLRDGQLELAKDIVDNFLYEIREYGQVLNANRTYYLSRSQPPFLTEMILEIFRRTHDLRWLEQSLPAIEKYYAYWVSAPHFTAGTGLSLYRDLGAGPAPEVVASEIDARGRNEYELIREYFRTHQLAGYDAGQLYDRARDELTAQFYLGDRSMRESGFDPSNRFGPFGADCIEYNPVCLNSLLYLMETQMGDILVTTGHRQNSARWRQRARERAERINRQMWDEGKGLYFDYNFVTGHVHEYPFLTTFYPLWAGLATKEQAGRVVKNLPLFERAGGLQTSTHHSGDQWDAPFGWAPLQWIAVEGLRRYGYQTETNRISESFLRLLLKEYEKSATLEEKYDVVHQRADISKGIVFGYRSNEAGFGWTNAVFTTLLDQLPAGVQRALLR